MMLAGFETDAANYPTIDSNFPTAEYGIFTGDGMGVYQTFDANSALTNYNTRFTATATADFTTKTLDFKTSNTHCGDNCTLPANLNFSTTGLDFAVNNINVDIFAGRLSGKLDARFYGDAAQEFGGTFALNDANSNYYGAFGGKRNSLVPAEDVKGLTSFADSNRTDTDNITLYVDNAVQINITNYNTANITGSVVEFSYDSAGDFIDNNDMGTGFKLFLDGKTYTITGGTYRTSSSGEYIAVTNNDTSNDIDIEAVGGPASIALRFSRTSNNFGFTATHMARLAWYTTSIRNFGITGWESDVSDIPISGEATFTGRGQGFHTASENSLNNTYFDVNMDVDFNDRSVELAITETCLYANTSPCTPNGARRPHLDFTANATYSAYSNQVVFTDAETAGNVDTVTPANNRAKLSGTANAKFYGTGTDAATEFGGTFNLSNENAGYVGFFGAEKQ